ncbi:peptidylprolyl isomerase [Xanthomonadaceae bacterium JHOS43]|nr:peptidylprolyl isomerase [Xanthomonadaceae bacterium JHOS43]
MTVRRSRRSVIPSLHGAGVADPPSWWRRSLLQCGSHTPNVFKVRVMEKFFAGILLGLMFSGSAFSSETTEQPTPLEDEAVVAERGGVAITVGDMRTKIRVGLSGDARKNFFADPKKVSGLINELLVTRQIAEEARKTGFDKDPEIEAEVRRYAEELVARRFVSNYLDGLDEPDYELLAQERYIGRKEEFSTPVTRNVRHILVLVDREKSLEEAKAIADKAHEALVGGADFDDVFREYSDDPNKELNGWVRGVDKKKFEPAFAETVFEMKEEGEISEPVLTAYGYHIIRYEGEVPGHTPAFEEVKDQILAQIRTEFRTGAREAYIDRFLSLPLELNDDTMTKLPTAEP